MPRLNGSLGRVALAALGAGALFSFAPRLSAAPQAAAPGVALRWASTDARTRVVAGTLSAPSGAAPEAIAVAYVATQPEALNGARPGQLGVGETRALRRGGHAVELVQRHAGLDVLGGGGALRLDATGRVRWAAGWPANVPADLDVTPRVTATQAIAVLSAEARWSLPPGGFAAVDRSRLIIDARAPGASPRLAWQIVAPRNLTMLETWHFVVDAHTGALISSENLVRHGANEYRGNVFENNPTKSNNVTLQVPLFMSLDTTQTPEVFLVGPDIKVQNCIDRSTCQAVSIMGFNVNIHLCEFEASASTAPGFDFVGITRPATDDIGANPPDEAAEDQFAEVQMFYHSNKAYAQFRTYGFTDLTARPLTAIVNARSPVDFGNIAGTLMSNVCSTGAPPAGAQLFPLDNAAFAPGGAGLIGGPAEDLIVFGQGTAADFAYDGDVVYHEFTHAVMGTVSPLLGSVTLDASGVDPTTGGMHEGFADYFSAVITGDPELAEYAGAALGGGTFLRTLENTKTCPEDLWGEVHQDGEPWAGALWDIRTALPDAAAQDNFDEGVYTVVTMLGAASDQTGTAAMIEAEVLTRFDAATQTLAHDKFVARGYQDDCNARVIDLTTGSKDVLFLGGNTDFGVGVAPAPVQFLIDVPADATSINVHIAASQFGGGLGGGTAPDVRAIVKSGDAPIAWSYGGGSATHDATAVGNVVFTGSPGLGTVSGGFAAGSYVVQLVSHGGGGQVAGISIDSTAGDITPDAGVMPDAAATPDAGTPADGDGGGCGCRAGGAGSTSSWALLCFGLAAFLMVLAVRRRR